MVNHLQSNGQNLKYAQQESLNQNEFDRLYLLAKESLQSNKTRRIALVSILFICYLQLSVTPHNLRNLRSLKCTNKHDIACTILQWTGEPLSDLPKEDRIEATVVVSHCGEHLSGLTKYLDDKSENIVVRDVIVTTGCEKELSQDFPYDHVIESKSKWKAPVMNFIEWLTAHLKPETLNSLPDHYCKENHVLLFISPEVINSSQKRALDHIGSSSQIIHRNRVRMFPATSKTSHVILSWASYIEIIF